MFVKLQKVFDGGQHAAVYESLTLEDARMDYRHVLREGWKDATLMLELIGLSLVV